MSESSEIVDPLTFVMVGEPAVEQTFVPSDCRKYVDGFEYSLPVANTQVYFEAGTHQLLVYWSCTVHFRVTTLDHFQYYAHHFCDLKRRAHQHTCFFYLQALQTLWFISGS